MGVSVTEIGIFAIAVASFLLSYPMGLKIDRKTDSLPCRIPMSNATMVQSRTLVANIQPQMAIDQAFRVLDKQHRSNRQGSMYLLLQLGDRSGVISALRWNSNDRIYESIAKGGFVQVNGTAQLHNGVMQIIVSTVEPLEASAVDRADFEIQDTSAIEKNWRSLQQQLQMVSTPDLRTILEQFYADEKLVSRFKRAPAGIKTHHAYPGGLLVHVLQLTRLAEVIAEHYPRLDHELLMMGVLFHDMGKIEELSYDNELNYSDAGQLIGHLVQGIEILNRLIYVAEAGLGRPLDINLTTRLKHMIVSHHGQLEYGSAKVPMTLEAIALAHLDDLDAKLNAAIDTISADRNTDSVWTLYHPVLGKRLFKPSLKS